MNIYERETANSIKLELTTLLKNEPETPKSELFLKNRLLQVKPAFEKIIENCGSTYAPVLAQCKHRYDKYIEFLQSKQAAVRIKHDLQAQRMHESSANEIYSRRQEEIRRKIDILKKKRELTNSELKSWQEKSYKLKLEPDIIEIDPYEEERARREKLKSFPKNYHKIPGLKLDDLSFEYTNSLKIKWTERLEKVEGIKKSNFLDKTELVELENKLGELKNSCSETEKSILAEIEKSNKLKNLIAKIRSKSQTSLNEKLSDHRIGQTPTDCEETSEQDSLLLKFWELLHEENHVSNLKAVTLALTNRKFHVAGTLAIFSEHDFKTMKLDVYEMSVNRSFNPRSTAYQFASGLDKIINYDNADKTIHSDLTDGIIEILRENSREKHIKRASLNCARMLSLTGDTWRWNLTF